MADQPKDLTVGQVTKETETVLLQAGPDLDKAKKAIDSILDSQVNSPELRTRATAIKAGIDSGISTAEDAVQATSKLLKEFSFPLAIVGGVPLKGSGVLATDAAGALQGLKTSMTKNQKIIRTVYGIVVITAGAAIAIAVDLQKGSLLSPEAGAGVVAICSGIKEILAVLNAAYKGVTGSDLS